MGQVMHIDQIVKRVETLIGQLENLRFSKKVMLAAKLQGHIEEAVEVGGLIFTETWTKRINGALANVGIDEPKSRLVDDSGLAALGAIPVSAQSNITPPQL
jgi:hypothetical protein